MQHLKNSNKALLLVFPYNVMAHYLRCLQLAKHLSPYFHIKFLYSARYHSFVVQEGFETFECATLDADKVQASVGSFDFSWLNERDLEHIYKEQLKTIERLNASAVLGDMSPTLKMAAEKTGVRYFSLINGYMSRYYAYRRRMPRNHPLYKLFNLLPTSLFQYFTNIGEQMFFHDMHRPFSKIRKREKLSPKHSYMQELEGDVNLICDLPHLFPQNNLPLNYFFIPPLYYHLKGEDDEIIDNLDRAKKTLFVSMGSTGSWQGVAFLNGAAYHKYNIVTAGDNEKVLTGKHVFSYPFINSSKLFSMTDVVICHGGNGTAYQALSCGIPVLCKTAHLEQDYNVDGLERLGVGKSLEEVAIRIT
jgi:UDP:flavonoid glycosyltransferase YjiC (YdhE family)